MTGDSKPRFWRWFAGQRHWDDDVGKLSIKFSDDPHAPHSAARFVSYVRWHVDATHEDRVASENAVAAWKKL